MVPADEWLVWR